MTILITGTAGFIGFHAAQRLLAAGHAVYGVDNLNAYYDTRLKADRLEQLQGFADFRFQHAHVEHGAEMLDLFQRVKPTRVLHLAAQPGVRYSIDNPWAYAKANLDGFLSILEACRAGDVEHLVYASSSSVYGDSATSPFKEEDDTSHALSLYAATKKSNELMAHSYSHLYKLRTTGLRYFTVYGPWGRPDMSIWRFTQAIETGAPIGLFNHGDMTRDFTYIDDIIDGTVAVLCNYPLSGTRQTRLADSAGVSADPREKADTLATVFNIGGQNPEPIMRVVAILEELLGKSARCEYLPHQPGDVLRTCADLGRIKQAIGYERKVVLAEGLERWVRWFRNYRALQ